VRKEHLCKSAGKQGHPFLRIGCDPKKGPIGEQPDPNGACQHRHQNGNEGQNSNRSAFRHENHPFSFILPQKPRRRHYFFAQILMGGFGIFIRRTVKNTL
jgi:hypothetical protein